MMEILGEDAHIVSYIYNIRYIPYLRHSHSLVLCYLHSSTCFLDLIILSKQILLVMYFLDSPFDLLLAILCFNLLAT